MLKPDEIVISLKQVRLKLKNGSLKNYIGFSTMKLDSTILEEGYYSSYLQIYGIEDGKFKMSFFE